MIDEILPPAARSAETFTDLDAPLHPAEERNVERAVDKRRREFTTVRACARQALHALGHAPAPILPGPGGAPQWPAGVVGSMTHCDGYRACAVAARTDLAAIGIDAEPHQPLPDGVLSLVSLPVERASLEHLSARRPDVCWDRLLFCAKEAVYKAWFPLAERWLGFDQAVVALDPDGTFTAELLVPGPVVGDVPVRGFAGRWLARHGLALTVVHVPATRPAG
ncbi:MAG TPA: 4'-phosphopantetheinyl transferase superfamily protein [Micromonosporaceae bacterium]|nr:4'-phosphopantetheinyl transferase superfamily protein [Micromonosporaceae bacterium]